MLAVSVLSPHGSFHLKWVSIFGRAWRVFIAPVFWRSDTIPVMWFRQWGTDLMKCLESWGQGSFPPTTYSWWLPCSLQSLWSMCQIPGLDTCREIIHMTLACFWLCLKKCNKTLQYNQHDSMLFLDFKILRLDVLMICSGATFKGKPGLSCQHIWEGDGSVFPATPFHRSTCHVWSSGARACSWWSQESPVTWPSLPPNHK